MSEIGRRAAPLAVRVIPVLEVGGTHVTAAWVDPAGWTVRDVHRRDIDATAPASTLLHDFAGLAAELAAAPGSDWGVAMPGPFDYVSGIAAYTGVGKFESLYGIDVRQALLDDLAVIGAGVPRSISFINDASAFLVGEWLTGAAQGTTRSAAITLGTGIGSAFLAHGVVIDSGPDVPPDAEAHLLVHLGRPLEDWVSRRAIRRNYAALTGGPEGADSLDVKEIAGLARAGDPAASALFESSFELLGGVLGPWMHRFGAEVLVLGGSISRSWDLIEKPLQEGLSASGDVTVRLAADAERSALVGSAYPAFIRTA
ncbi:MAG: hypothetical protein QOE71_2929 [Pseudonocardiales bacterium]|jgi:glucokinase|nr:hypothetical protein [Pseudonocardiales bacterium]